MERIVQHKRYTKQRAIWYARAKKVEYHTTQQEYAHINADCLAHVHIVEGTIMSTVSIPTVTLSSGYAMPILGLGTYKAHGSELDITRQALDMGYRLIDTAWIYKNEADVGAAIAQSNTPRSEIFLVSKVWPNYFKADLCKQSIERTLTDLRCDYIDMMYLHWWGTHALEAWKVLESYHEQGIIRTISVSNFTKENLHQLDAVANVQPACNQIEVHPLWPEVSYVSYLKERGIQPVAYCPIARAQAQVMESPIIQRLAHTHQKTPTQIVLAWHIARGIAPIPKTVHTERLYENADIFDITLTEDEIAAINELSSKTGKIGHPMDDAQWLAHCEHEPRA